MTVDIKTLSKDYFKAFESKNLSALSEMFADDIYLRDWVSGVMSGKDKVLEANKGIFESNQKISVVVTDMFCQGLTAACEIEITFNDKDMLMVMDVIGFDQDGKMKFVRAYKGN